MTKRYYYDDPLAAMWMARHFDMRFTDRDGAEICVQHHRLMPPRPIDGFYYIHPDSKHLLEPREGDGALMQEFGWSGACVKELYRDGCGGIEYDDIEEGEEPVYQAVNESNLKGIIYRNGHPFHWPKVEEKNND